MTTHFVCEICGYQDDLESSEDFAYHEKTYMHQRALLSRAVDEFVIALTKPFRDILERWVKK